MTSEPQHILVIHVAGLGQTVLALPALRSLRAHLPEAGITIASSEAAADLIRLAGCANEVLPVGRFRHAELLNPKTFFRSTKTIGELRHAHYDLAIEFKTNAEAAAVLNFAHPQRRLNTRRGRNQSLGEMIEKVTQAIATTKPSVPLHLAQEYLKKLEPLGVRPIEAEPRLATDRQADEQIDKLLRKHKVEFGELLVGIHPGAGLIRNRWPLERFVSIGARMIHNFNARLLVFAGPQEKGLAKRIVSQLAEKHAAKRAIAVQSPKIPELVSAFARLSLLIANHSGPAHIAAAVGAPVVVVSAFNPSFGKVSSMDVLGNRNEHVRASHPGLISEEAVYEAACRLLKMNRAEFLRNR
ncbi:MAG TPA: glycosyltransferase family 9 protein [Blastocatellia bacterium]|nr:glycosyltransferase family 9 protein [Blastocatellia bacterium]HMX28057.1 glycosyltransferase family 9 protein [Blastocatellia bacterium]